MLAICVGCRQNKNFLNQQIKTSEDSIDFIQIKTDSIFNSNQIISLLILQKKMLLINLKLNSTIVIQT